MSLIERLEKLATDLRSLGCETSISITVKWPEAEPAPAVPVPAPVPTPAGELDLPPKATARTIMFVLNKLKAAPGQPNRELVRKFLYVRGWVGPAEPPENWKIDYVPVSTASINALIAQIVEFEKTQAPTAATGS